MENYHRYSETNGVQIMATLRSLAMNALRLNDFWSITEGMAALVHDIPGLIESPSKACLQGLRAWAEVGWIALCQCPRAFLPQPISI